ncbi:hypothetical protein CDAR_197651 [Caerostris darwini]|uniref:Uncharacterized protein n=1 Tax=Caerostris darwini TaxID=1538125 RepID=A0AAV4RVA7_9ARAC|nr:hypothetical protein CDAR_197651 [Caerostris darwini]
MAPTIARSFIGKAHWVHKCICHCVPRQIAKISDENFQLMGCSEMGLADCCRRSVVFKISVMAGNVEYCQTGILLLGLSGRLSFAGGPS